jgi:NADH-quinone oxidoreductase subunit L
MTNHFLSLIVFAPLIGAAICWLVGRRIRSEAFIGTVACASIGVSTVIAFIIAFTDIGHAGHALEANQPVMSHLWTWMEVGNFRADFGFAMDRLSGIYACFITFIGLLIHVFATGYMHGDKSFYRFFAYLNLFMFMMLTLVLADNLLLMFVGWEGVGLCSYLLIGYYVDRREAGDAAKKAFIANRIGDWGVILGIMFVFFITANAGAPSISFFAKEGLTNLLGGAVPGMTSAFATIANLPIDSFTLGALIAGGLTSAAILLFIGATGKSAQIPLFVWLPDAMAGPTPVSALIHAATMVTAGVYMIVRCSELYVRAPTAMAIIAVIGAATAIFAATIGLAQNDIKKVLAYSTVSQLGYMMLACGVGAFSAAIFHVMTHAFFKALLFLGSGSVIHGMHHEQDMRRMGGLKKYMPVTYLTMFAGWLAIAGIIPFAGFWSKDEILYKTFSTQANDFGFALWIVGIITALLTAVYMTRMMVMTFWGKERFYDVPAGGQADEAHAHAYDIDEKPHAARKDSEGDRPQHQAGDAVHASTAHGASTHGAHHADDDEAHEHHGLAPNQKPHESPLVMTIPLVILAVLSTVGGLVGVPYAISSLVGAGDINKFEHTLAPAVAKLKFSTHGTDGAHATPPLHEGVTPALHGESATHTDTTHNPAAAEGAHAHSPEEIRNERLLAFGSFLLALAGIGIGWMFFRNNPLRRLPRAMENKWYVDEIYDATLIEPIKDGSRVGLWRIFDVGIIDGLVNGVGTAMRSAGGVLRQLQPGFVRSYAALILIGALAVVAYFGYLALSSAAAAAIR